MILKSRTSVSVRTSVFVCMVLMLKLFLPAGIAIKNNKAIPIKLQPVEQLLLPSPSYSKIYFLHHKIVLGCYKNIKIA